MKAVITGVTGQDGFYLTHYLLQKGYQVIGIDRRKSGETDPKLRMFKGTPNFIQITADVTDISSIQDVLNSFKPDEFYHLAAQSHVGVSYKNPFTTSDIVAFGTLVCLEAIRDICPKCKFYFAGSSEQFGNTIAKSGYSRGGFFPLNEGSSMHPVSPYAVSKLFGYHMTKTYRRSYGMFASCGILFNHESPVRGLGFVTRKITHALANIHHGKQGILELGNLDARRDWGFAGDYIKAMHAILQHDKPDDFVIATGRDYSVEEFLCRALDWYKTRHGRGWDDCVEVNKELFRPSDVNVLVGDTRKANAMLGWEPKITFEQLTDAMCEYDYHLCSDDPNLSRQAERFMLIGEQDGAANWTNDCGACEVSGAYGKV